MVERLFEETPPTRESEILDPGCGPGAFIEGIIRWCERHHLDVPRITGIELDSSRAREASSKFSSQPSVTILQEDFLLRSQRRFDYVIGNPPYVSITHFSEEEKETFRAEYRTARGRFDLYLLFFEQALSLLKPNGRLVFITPEKFLYVKTAESLRRLLSSRNVREIRLADEETFGALITYPAISVIDNCPPRGTTRVTLRDQTAKDIHFPGDGSSLLPLLSDGPQAHGDNATLFTLNDICIRVSCGVATGAVDVFVQETNRLGSELASFAYPTIAGKQLVPGQRHVRSEDSLLIPYDQEGRLIQADELGALGNYLAMLDRRERLEVRTCVRRKPWWAFHDSVPLKDILRPKLLCKDIAAAPSFWIDREGTLVPRHSVYYLVPRDPALLDEIAAYLNSEPAIAWMRAHCQRAANGFIRLQSSVLKRLPIPESLAGAGNKEYVGRRRRPPVRAKDANLELFA